MERSKVGVGVGVTDSVLQLGHFNYFFFEFQLGPSLKGPTWMAVMWLHPLHGTNTIWESDWAPSSLSAPTLVSSQPP